MPTGKYIKVLIDNEQMELESIDALNVSLSYKLEDTEDFQKKKSAESFGIKFPATLLNDKVSNTFHNPGIEDQTTDQIYKSARPAIIEANGYELLIGKAFLKSATHSNRPLGYQYDFYGGNNDWVIDLKEATLFDFLSHISFTFSLLGISDSWAFDGTDENLPYVFAPVRYGEPMGDPDSTTGVYDDKNMKPEYMKPSISKYWLIYWAFKSIGYRVKSDFFDTEYFRRQVMPWTWGNFLYSEGTRLNNLDFLAKSVEQKHLDHVDGTTNGWDLDVSNDSTGGAFDNNNSYSWDTVNHRMTWTYLSAFNYGPLEGTFHFDLFVDALVSAGSDLEVWVQWYKNGVVVRDFRLLDLHAPVVGKKQYIGSLEDWLTVPVVATDVISARVNVIANETNSGRVLLTGGVDAYELDFFRVPLGGTIDFSNYTGFKKYKFLDFLRGVIDEFNLIPGTDPTSKVVYFEPAHPYSVDNDMAVTSPGYFNGEHLDFTDLQDVSESKVSELTNYSDSERELLFKYKDDSSDGILKVVQDRNLTTLAQGKYVLPDRFKAGKREIENRFFSAVMHYDVDQWAYISGEAPQMICMVPENISNTSKQEAQNTFQPKSAYYKGIVSGYGWVFNGVEQTNFPFMFAVNYKPGGEDDPILSYSDEKIGTDPTFVVGKGLLRRFYMQRMAIMRNGQYYTTHFRLNNLQISNFLHREHIICRGQRWELVEINNYKPLAEASTECFLRKWVPPNLYDDQNVFPLYSTVLDTAPMTNSFDIKYQMLKALPSDIPK
jgi:hypothetical protein